MIGEVNGVIPKEIREVGEKLTSINQMIQNVEKSEKVEDLEVEIVALVDSGADMNLIL